MKLNVSEHFNKDKNEREYDSDWKSLIVVSFYITIEKYNLLVHWRLSINYNILPQMFLLLFLAFIP